MLLLEIMGGMGMDAVGVQDSDLRYGVDSLLTLGEQWNIPFLCANLSDPGGESVLPGWRVLQAGAERIGVISAMDTRLQNTRFLPKGYSFTEPEPLIAEGVRILRDEEACTQIVLLFGGRKDRMQEVCGMVGGIDFAFYGNAGNSLKAPTEMSDGTRVMTAGNRGRDYGEVVVERGESGKPEITSYVIHVLDKKFPNDPVLQERVDALLEESRQRKRRQRLIEEIAQQNSSNETSEVFMGKESCKSCHIREYEIWTGNPHANTLAVLAADLQDTNPECVGCHVTGWEMPGGYGLNVGNREMLSNVQCEACHNYGTMHSRGDGNLAAARASCASCHNAEMSPDFDFASYWERIRH